jgi:hypothetical protein
VSSLAPPVDLPALASNLRIAATTPMDQDSAK